MLKRIYLLCPALVALAGCDALMPPRADGATVGDGSESAQQSIEAALDAASQLPPPAPAQPQPAPGTAGMPIDPREARFDISTEATPAQAFFMALVDETPHNIVVHPDVDGEISLMLKQVTVAEVLDVVSEVYGYHYRRTPAGYVVFPATLQSRIFHINYLDLQRSGVSRTRVSSGQVSEGNRRSGGGGIGVIGGAAGGIAPVSTCL